MAEGAGGQDLAHVAVRGGDELSPPKRRTRAAAYTMSLVQFRLFLVRALQLAQSLHCMSSQSSYREQRHRRN